MELSMLTTTDNPYDPFTDYAEWFAFDSRMGYHTPSYLARLVVTSHELSDSDQRLAIDSVIDEIVKENILGLYTKVTRDVPVKHIT